MEIIDFKGNVYPKFQSEGFAAKFAFPYALEVCKGVGLDVGCNRKDWSLPGSIPIDPVIDARHNAMSLPTGEFDYIFSSHCLEHVDRWVDVLDYWTTKIKSGGTIFLYLPDFSQHYWRPWHNKKHVHCFTREIISAYFRDNKNYKHAFASAQDLNNSFMVMAEKV